MVHLLFKINTIVSRTTHLLEAFIWINKKKKDEKVDLCCFLILIKAFFQVLLVLAPSLGGGCSFKLPLKFSPF